MQYSSATLALAAAFGASLTLAHGGVESIAVSKFESDFASAKIVPDVLPAFKPSVSFYAGYASTDGDDGLVMPGMNLTTAGTSCSSLPRPCLAQEHTVLPVYCVYVPILDWSLTPPRRSRTAHRILRRKSLQRKYLLFEQIHHLHGKPYLTSSPKTPN